MKKLQMKKRTKVVLTVLCVLSLLLGSVLGSIAYLTSEEQAKNTFNFGKVKITLDEAAIDDYGKALRDAPRVPGGNDYSNCVPGETYDKDPTVHVENGPCYIRVFVKFDKKSEIGAIARKHGESVDLGEIFSGYDPAKWSCIYNSLAGGTPLTTIRNLDEANEGYLEFWYVGNEGVADAGEDHTLFDQVKIPTWLDSYDADSLNDFSLSILAQAIQTQTFDDAAEAWGGETQSSFDWPAGD